MRMCWGWIRSMQGGRRGLRRVLLRREQQQPSSLSRLERGRWEDQRDRNFWVWWSPTPVRIRYLLLLLLFLEPVCFLACPVDTGTDMDMDIGGSTTGTARSKQARTEPWSPSQPLVVAQWEESR